MVKNNYGSIYYYFYCAHYAGVYYKEGKRYRKITWHYIGKIAITPNASENERNEELRRGINQLLGNGEKE